MGKTSPQFKYGYILYTCLFSTFSSHFSMLCVTERIYLQGKWERVNDIRKRHENSFGPAYHSVL